MTPTPFATVIDVEAVHLLAPEGDRTLCHRQVLQPEAIDNSGDVDDVTCVECQIVMEEDFRYRRRRRRPWTFSGPGKPR